MIRSTFRAICSALLALSFQVPASAEVGSNPVESLECVLDWAERTLPQELPNPTETLTFAPFHARCYANLTLCLGSDTVTETVASASVYLYTPYANPMLQNIGPLSYWTTQAQCNNEASPVDFPASNKTITIVVPFAPGGVTDILARNLVQTFREKLGMQVVVDNASGAGSTIGSARVAGATPDGYTLLVNSFSMSTMPARYRNLDFSVSNDFEYLGMISDSPLTLVARKDFPANNLQELLAYLEATKDEVSLANMGLGHESHLCGELFKAAIGTELITVPYNSSAGAMLDLMTGQVDLMCGPTASTEQHIKDGRIKVLGVTVPQRVPALPNVPTMDEQGLKGFDVKGWHGLYAPKGTPANVVKKINDALKTALKDPIFIRSQESLGAVVVTDKRMDPTEHKTFVLSEIERWGAVIRNAGAFAD